MSCQAIKASIVLIFLLVNVLIYWCAQQKLAAGWKKYVQDPIQYPSIIKDLNVKTILLWTTRYQLQSWEIPEKGFSWEGNQHTDLRDFGCDQESYKCTITSNRSYLEDESLYDGIMFHQGDINDGDIPDQDKRAASQVYIYNTLESPATSLRGGNDPVRKINFFNVSMTYSSKSKLHTPYGKIVQTESHPLGEELDQFIMSYGERNARRISNKTLFAAILVSNCNSASQREKVISDLSSVVPVDVFGACGSPPPGGKFNLNADGHMNLGQTYQFYLAFENSLCEDYVTEKFFNILQTNMIPVVMNGANMSRIAPKHSYIDVKDFSTIRELGKYLQQVSADSALYASYFWWKEHYEVEDTTLGRHFIKTFCEACGYLHSGRGPVVVKEMQKEWMENQCMQRPDITYIDEEEILTTSGGEGT